MNLKEKVLIRKDLEAGDYVGVIARVDLILDKEKNSYLYYLKAKSLYNLTRYNDSLNSIQKALHFSDANTELLLLAGRIYFKLNYFQKAEEFYLHALKIKPDYVEALASYSFLLYILGYDTKAEVMLKKAFSLDRENIFTLIAFYKIALYNQGYKKYAYKLEQVVTHARSEIYYQIHSALISLYNGKRREAAKTIRKALPEQSELFAPLHSLLSIKKVEKNKKSGGLNTIIFSIISILLLPILFYINRNLFILWLLLLLLLLLSILVSNIRKIYKIFKAEI